ncbi:MAG TPA: ABC transporter permease [Candidatus Binataceae bacterium]|nr:ABC transporter permease [Candidatus Binataceae bacterium]
MRYEFKIALRYLKARRKEAFISVTTLFTALGVMLGVAALTLTLSVMGGLEASLRARVLAVTPQIEIQSYSGAITNYGALVRRARNIPGVTAADPFIVAQAMVSSAGGVSGVVVRGIDATSPGMIAKIGAYIRAGSLANLAQTGVQSGGTAPTAGTIALGTTLAERLKVKVGDTVRVVAPIVSGGQLTTKAGRFRVGAIFESGVDFVDRDLVFMGLAATQTFFGRPDQADGIELHLANLDDTEQITQVLRTKLGQHYAVRNWINFNHAASAGFALLKWVYSAVLLLLIGVAAFNLIATLIMVVMEKRKDIAVLITMGASRSAIRLVFVLKGLIVGAVGTAAGLLLSALGCFALAHYHFIHIPKAVYGISTVPIAADPFNFVLVAFASLTLCLLATIYPARQALRETPAEVLR